MEMLHYLTMLLKHGNFTKAAKDLYISQPYLTQAIKKVEEELGTEIINRKVSPLQLTESGKVYYEYLASIEDQQNLLKAKLDKLNHPEQKILKIGILSSLGTYLLPRFLPEYLEKYPDVLIDLHEDFPENNEKNCLDGKLDFFIGQNPETVSPKLNIHSCGLQKYYALIPKSSPLYQKDQTILKKSISLKKILQSPLVLTKRGSAVRRQIDYLLQKYHIEPNIIIQSSNIFTTKELAKNGIGVTIIPESVLSPFEEGTFNIYPIKQELLSLGYFITYSSKKRLTDFEVDFVKTFEKKLQNF
jgi:DNA-binding transcriptional LysR family regulator